MKNYLIAAALVMAAVPCIAQKHDHHSSPHQQSHATAQSQHGSFGGHSRSHAAPSAWGVQGHTQTHSHTYTHTRTRSSGSVWSGQTHGHSYSHQSGSVWSGQTHGHSYSHQSGSVWSGQHNRGHRAGHYRNQGIAAWGNVRVGGGHGHYSLRPTGHGHPKSWFEGRRWHEGPAWVTPRYHVYAGYHWRYRPSDYDVVWIYDPDTGEYYEAYYYPQYGYYAWASDPLVAIGVYSPSISIRIGL